MVITSVVTSGPAKRGAVQSGSGTNSPSAASTETGVAAAEAGELPWQLAAPISREVVLPDNQTNSLLIAGGLSSSGTSDSGIYALDTTNGRLTSLGSLGVATHDAAGTLVNGDGFVIGGGTAAPSSATQRFGTNGSSLSSGSLNQARADAGAVTIGDTAYIVGGYDGPSLDAEVLATTDGLHFREVAALAIPVRYPAVAVLDNKIYVFGGEASDGRPARTVQMIDPSSHTASVLGQLPLPIAGAVAANLDGTIYLVGSESTTRSSVLSPIANIYTFVPSGSAFLRAGSLPVAVSNAGAAMLGRRLWIVGGETAGSTPSGIVQMIEPNRRFGVAGSTGAGSPFFGEQLLIADRGNNRLLVLNDADKVIWTYPSKGKPAPPGGFYFPDDAFFIHHGTAILSNQEENETLVEIAYPSGRTTWQYGHPRVAGSAPGYLNNPDDAYLLKNGDITVADPKNCRVLVLSREKKVLTQIGTNGACVHNPPSELGSPNGDTPLSNGNLLVSEINGSWIDEYTTTGKLVWTVHLPIGYPSDPQQVGPDRYLVANYGTPVRSSSSTAPGRSSTASSQPLGRASSTSPPLSSNCRQGCSC